MRELDLLGIPRLIDVSGVRTDVTLDEIDRIVAATRKHHFIAAFAMPCFTQLLVNRLADMADVMVGAVVGFPSGADTTFIKVAGTKEMLSMGVDELDMVINVGALKSGRYDIVLNDIGAVVDTAGDKPVKVILEVCYLTDDEIMRGAELAVKAGAAYVKTGTGWGPAPTTVETIRLIKRTIGDAALLKAAGGVRTLDTLLDMVDAGCSRFGIGVHSALKIVEEAYARTSLLVQAE
jgi:deoxyribose-phosphate aldolase